MPKDAPPISQPTGARHVNGPRNLHHRERLTRLRVNPMLPVLALLGTTEWIIIIAIVVLFFGAAKIPQLARSLGRAKGEFEKGAREGKMESSSNGAAKDDDERILKAARELGIPTEGRPIADVKRDVRAKLG